MLSLSRPSGLASHSCRNNRTPTIPRAHVRSRAMCRPVAAATAAAQPQSAGPACKTLLSLPDNSWQSLMDLIVPQTPEADQLQHRHGYVRQQSAIEQMVRTLEHTLKCTVQVAHPEAAGASSVAQALRTMSRGDGQYSTVVLKLPDFKLADHSELLTSVKDRLSQVSWNAAQQGRSTPTALPKGACIYYTTETANLRIIASGSEPTAVLAVLNPKLSTAQREVLSSGTVLASTAFLQQQPALYHTAVKAAKHWVARQGLPGKQQKWEHQSPQANRTADYLIDLLVLKAYQDYETSVAALKGPAPDQAAALDAVLTNFLQLAANLPNIGVVSWEYLYSKETALQVIGRPDLAKVLRPDGCESHPIVLDPVDPTTNVAAALSSNELQAFSAAAKDAAAKCSAAAQVLVTQRVMHQIPGIEEQLQAMRLHQKILIKGGGNWTVAPKPIKHWLPADDPRDAGGLTDQDAQPFGMRIMSIPLQPGAESDDAVSSPILGIELRLAVTASPR